MADNRRSRPQAPGRWRWLDVPLFRLLAINLATGIALAMLLVGGLLVINTASTPALDSPI